MWKKIKGFENYAVNEIGEVRALAHVRLHTAKRTGVQKLTLKRRMILKPQPDKLGYLHVRLWDDKGHAHLYKLHHLVAEAFLGYDRKQYDRNNLDSLVVSHLNGIKADCRVENLVILTQRENLSSEWRNRPEKIS